MKKLFSRITLFLLLSVVGVIGMLYVFATQASNTQQGNWMIAAMLLPVIGAMILVDLLLRKMFPVKTYWIWLIEFVLLLGIFYAWIIQE
jgi:hypothetical protein